MPKAYSEDLRRRVVADTDKGLSIRAVADKYSVSPSFVSKITCLWRQEGSVSPRKIGGYRRHALEAHAAEVRGKLLEDKGITLAQLRDWIEEVLGVRVHVSSVDRFIRSLGYSYKKNTAGQRTRTC
ncbi:winged helix-turn-helix domain-containing protein [Nitrosomonas europaea]|uniref:winged helix-turn-helix domain-containing protein n=1 Tax=Nitrosomonas europaea TaxID=915 RepID=UPI0032673CDA